jgi:hypothetical protein
MSKTARRLSLLAPLFALLGFAWIPAGDSGTIRYRHGATLLASGRVLVSGGNAGPSQQPSATAQLFEAPSTWLPAASMAEARFLHTQTRLADGRVLVTGGHPGPLASAEIYDPASDTWTGAAPMNRARAQHTASLLPDGRVVVVGGIPGPQTGLAEVEVYDPAVNTWTLKAPLNLPRYDHSAVVLGDGRLLVVGGNSGTDQISTCEIYDPALNFWNYAVALLRRRQLPTAALLPGGKVLVAGGLSYDAFGPTAELIDPASATGTLPAGPLLQDRYNHASAVLADGRVLVVGGYSPSAYFPLATAEVYDPAANAWSSAGVMSALRYFHTATTLPSGRVMIVGGIGINPYPTTSEVWVQDAVPPVITAPALITAEMTSPQGAAVSIPATAVDDVDGPVPVTSDAPSIFPQGDTIVHLRASDRSGNVATATVTVRVVDTTPPTIQSVTATPSVLTPAKNQMVPVTIAVQATDVGDPAPASRITAVAGNGGSSSDWTITGPLTVSLKAAKVTGATPARIYTITVTCTDRSGNGAQKAVTVTVQK